MVRKAIHLALIVYLCAGSAWAERVTLPAGTVVYGEIQERVTSRKKETSEGDVVSAIVWRDVRLDGDVVIQAGTPIFVRVSRVKKAKVAGIKGQVELRAFSTTAVDGTSVPLIGGYDKSGKGRMALSITLAAVVFVPLIFIKGKQAVLDPGTIFDAQIQGNTQLEIERVVTPRKLTLGGSDLAAEVLYDDIPEKGKPKFLPVRLTLCSGELPTEASVITVNEKEVEPIPIQLSGAAQVDQCSTSAGRISLEALGKHFGRGINRFEILCGGELTEVVLDIEL